MSLSRGWRVRVFLGTPRGQILASLLWVLAGLLIIALLGLLLARSDVFSWTPVLGLAVPLLLAVLHLVGIVVGATQHDCGRRLAALRGRMERSAHAMTRLAGVSVTAGLVGFGMFFAVLNRQGVACASGGRQPSSGFLGAAPVYGGDGHGRCSCPGKLCAVSVGRAGEPQDGRWCGCGCGDDRPASVAGTGDDAPVESGRPRDTEYHAVINASGVL